MTAPVDHVFTPFSMQHAAALAWTGALLGVAIFAGLVTRGTSRQRTVDRVLAIYAIAANIFSQGLYLTPAHLSWTSSLPLHLCDVAGLLTPVALLLPERARWARTLVYFWGLGLCSQAFITPTLTEAFPSGRYIQFWTLHLAIVGAAVYDVVCRGYRPSFRDWRFAMLVSVAYFLASIGINSLISALGGGDANYVYTGNTRPENPTIIDRLGPWPWRLVPLAMVGSVIVTLLHVIWPASAWMRWRVGGSREGSMPA